MQQKKTKLSTILLFLGAGLTAVQAQVSMNVKENTGTQTSYALTNIRKLTFPTGNMLVTKTDGSTNTYALSGIRYLNFTDLTTSIAKDIQANSNMMLYPNPVTDRLQISYESLKVGRVQVEIMDVQGKILYQQTINCQNGPNQAIIPVSQLSEGLYICRVQSDDKIEMSKFFKN